MKKIIIYTTENCKYCKAIKEELEKNNIKFENRITDEHKKEWQDIVSLLEIGVTPTIYYKGSYFVPGRDYMNPAHLINTLKNFNKSEFSKPIQILEKLKTLNHNMSVAFNRMEKLLEQIERKLY